MKSILKNKIKLILICLGCVSGLNIYAQSSAVNFYPDVFEVNIGDTVTTTMILTLGDAPISAFDIFLEFNNQFIEIIAVENVQGDLFTFIDPPSFDNAEGLISASAFQIGKALPDENIGIFTVKLIALEATELTELKHKLSGSPKTILAYGGMDMLSDAGALKVSVSPGEVLSAGSEKPSEIFGLTIWPNPTVKMARVQFKTSEEGQIDLSIYDLEGKLLEKIFEGNAFPGQEFQIEIDMEKYVAGNYLIRLANAEFSETKTLIKTK